MRQVPHLNVLHKDNLKRGLVVVGVAGDEVDEVKQFITKHAVGYPISVGWPHGYDIPGIPHAFLVDGEGKICWHGHPAELQEATLAKALEGARRADGLCEALDDVQQQMEAARFGAAWTLCQGHLAGGKLDAEATAQAKDVVAMLEGEVVAGLAAAESAAAEQDWYVFAQHIERVAKGYPGVPRADEAGQQLQELAGDRKRKREVAAGAKMAEAQALDDHRDFDKAHAAYKAVSSSFSGTKVAKAAAARYREMEKEGLLGFNRACGACQAEGKACDHHRKKR